MGPESCQRWGYSQESFGGLWVFTEIAFGVISSLMQSCVISKNKDRLDSKLSPNQQAFSPKYWNIIVTANWQLGSVQLARNIQGKNLTQDFKVKKRKLSYMLKIK